MSYLLKLVLTILVTSALFDKSSGHSTTRREEPEPEDTQVPADTAIIVVDAIRDLLEDAEDGATASDLKDHVDGITFIIEGILADADVEVDEAAAQEVIETVLATIYADDDAEEDDVKIELDEIGRAFALLSGLAEAIYGILETPERDGLYETLAAVEIAAQSLIETIEDMANSIVFTYDPEETGDDVDDNIDDGQDDDADDDSADEDDSQEEEDDDADDSDDADDADDDSADEVDGPEDDVDDVDDGGDVTRRHAGRFQ